MKNWEKTSQRLTRGRENDNLKMFIFNNTIIMRLASGSSFDQIDLPASNDAILDAYIAAEWHMKNIIDLHLDQVLRTQGIEEIPEAGIYALFNIPYETSFPGSQYWSIEKNKPHEAKIAILRSIMARCLRARWYELFNTPHQPFKIVTLEDSITSEINDTIRRLSDATPEFINQEVRHKVKSAMASV